MKTYNLNIKHKKTGEALSVSVQGSSMADAVGKLISGKVEKYKKVGHYRNGKPKYLLSPIVTDGKFEIVDAACPGIEFPELIGRTI